jgi:hypothetical protein
MKHILLLACALLLSNCLNRVPTSRTGSSGGMAQIINVSAYDPKERQRAGTDFSEHDVSALRANGASGLIARAGKGGVLDEKCASFVAAADRAGMLPGIYYRLQTHADAVAQADQFVNRAQSLARGRTWSAPSLLLCADFDANSRLSDILRFLDRVEGRTGVVPVAYLENSVHLRQILGSAPPSIKAKLRRSPYWAALYSHDGDPGGGYGPPVTPQGLVEQYNVWSTWSLWQYGGVNWEKGHSSPKVYSNGRYRFSPYFGNLALPAERNLFHGSRSELVGFWQRHGLKLR